MFSPLNKALHVSGLKVSLGKSIIFASSKITNQQKDKITNITSLNLENLGLTRFSGFVCDHEGSFLRGFYGNIDHSCIIYDDIHALYHDLQLCCSTDFRQVFCYSDFLYVIHLAHDPLNVVHRVGN